MSCGDNPPLVEKSPSTGNPLTEEGLLDDSSLPRVSAESGITASYDPVGSGVRLAAPDVIADSSKTVINMIYFVSWDTAGPDHAPRAEVYGLGPLEDTRDRQTAVILVALVPTLLGNGWHNCPGDIEDIKRPPQIHCPEGGA